MSVAEAEWLERIKWQVCNHACKSIESMNKWENMNEWENKTSRKYQLIWRKGANEKICNKAQKSITNYFLDKMRWLNQTVNRNENGNKGLDLLFFSFSFIRLTLTLYWRDKGTYNEYLRSVDNHFPQTTNLQQTTLKKHLGKAIENPHIYEVIIIE